jgi:hypothetical protein
MFWIVDTVQKVLLVCPIKFERKGHFMYMERAYIIFNRNGANLAQTMPMRQK